MRNPKTTIAGYLLIIGGLCTAAAHLLQGGISRADIDLIFIALTGLGLVAAKDGGH